MTRVLNRWLTFVDVTPVRNPRTRRWDILRADNGALLGWVSWYSRWRQYVFAPVTDAIFSDGCLQEIVTFVRMTNDAHRRADRSTNAARSTIRGRQEATDQTPTDGSGIGG